MADKDLYLSESPNVDKGFVEQDGKLRKTVLTAIPSGDLQLSDSANVSTGYVTDEQGKKHRVNLVAEVEGTLELPDESSSDTGYVVDGDGKKHKVQLTATLYGGGSAPVIDELNVTPSTSAQVITAPEGTDGYSPVNVSAVTSSIDANITAGNIKKDVSILGVTGSYEGVAPSGTKPITSNGVHDVAGYANADVQVPTTAPDYYIEKTTDGNGKLISGSSIINLSDITNLDPYILAYAYYNSLNVSGTVDFSSLTSMSGAYSCQNTFYGCTGLTSADLSSLTAVLGEGACKQMFYGCTGITSVDLSNLQYVSGANSCQSMFYGCTGITSVDLNSLSQVTANSGCSGMFEGCTGITSFDLKVLSSTGSSALSGMFRSCSNLTSFVFGNLLKISGSTPISYMFRYCTNLTDIKFSNLAYNSTLTNATFNNFLTGVTNCTVHFPAEWQTTMSSWSNVTNGFGGTNITVLFDLPNVRTINIPNTDINISSMYASLCSNYPAITTVNFTSTKTITDNYTCASMFSGCVALTTVNLGALEEINGYQSCYGMFQSCTSLNSINLTSLKSIKGYNACYFMFANGAYGDLNMSSLEIIDGQSAMSAFYQSTAAAKTIDLSSLTTIKGSSALSSFASSASGFTSANLSSLRFVDAASCFSYAFAETGLTSLSFPAIRPDSFGGSVNQFDHMLNNLSGITLHLPANTQSKIQTLTGYNTTKPFGATSGSILFDLPSTFILTGADTIEYERNPKDDTATALAWRKAVYDTDGFVADWTSYYTSGTTDPAVGDTIYSDGACTTAVTTISSIA